MKYRFLKILSLIIVAAIIFSTFTSAKELKQKDNTLLFTDDSKLDRSIVLSLPKDTEVSHFSFNLVGPVQIGSEQPWNITLDIGNNGTIDWAFLKEYGPLGYQKVFRSGDEQLDLGFVPGNYNSSGAIYLPAWAQITSAKIDMVYTSEDYLSKITEMNRPEWSVDAPYDYDPEMCIFQDRLFTAYRSYSWRDTSQSDADIVIKSTLDGETWDPNPIELTKAPDTEVPYTGGKRSGDYYPSLAVFKNKLYCAWESDSPLPNGTTHDNDRDIVWTTFDGSKWELPRELTAPNDNAAEDVYSENPGVKDDYRVQLHTFDNGSGEQLFAIWTANNTGDEEFPEERKGDIVISRTTDGETWTTGLDLTHNDRRYDEDFLPQLIEFKTPKGNALFAFWVSNNFEHTNGSDWDIFYRYTYDGITWSEQYNLIQQLNITEPVNNEEAIDDDPAVIVYDDELYLIWRTSNPNLALGNDIDIVMSHTIDGTNWSKPQEITPPQDTMFNNRPKAEIFKGDLTVLWRQVEDNDLGIIVVRILEKGSGQWTDVVEISPQGEGGNDYSGEFISFNDRMMVAWVTQDNITTRGTDADVVVRGFIPRNGTPEAALDIGESGEYKDTWVVEKTQYIDGQIINLDLTKKFQELYNDPNWLEHNTFKDEYGVEIVYIPITSYFSSPGKLSLSKLQIQYNYSFTIQNLGFKLKSYLNSMQNTGESHEQTSIEVQLWFRSDTNGKILLRDLKVVYSAPDENDQYLELLCIAAVAVIVIIVAIVYKIKSRPIKNNNMKNEIGKKQDVK